MTAPLTLKHIKDRNGSLKLTLEGPILIAEFTGSCSVRIGKAFKQGVEQAAPVLPKSGWCYLSASHDYVAALPEVEALYTQTYQLCMDSGCIVEAYCMPSAVGLAQVDKSRNACGVHSPIKEIAFDSIEAAKTFLLASLEAIQAKRREKQL